MNVRDEIFADTIGEISLAGGMVRMDLVSLVGSQSSGDNKPRFETKCRLVMPPEGFLRSFSAMENLVKQLIDAGLIRPNQPSEQTGFGQSGANPTPKSPNF